VVAVSKPGLVMVSNQRRAFLMAEKAKSSIGAG